MSEELSFNQLRVLDEHFPVDPQAGGRVATMSAMANMLLRIEALELTIEQMNGDHMNMVEDGEAETCKVLNFRPSKKPPPDPPPLVI